MLVESCRLCDRRLTEVSVMSLRNEKVRLKLLWHGSYQSYSHLSLELHVDPTNLESCSTPTKFKNLHLWHFKLRDKWKLLCGPCLHLVIFCCKISYWRWLKKGWSICYQRIFSVHFYRKKCRVIFFAYAYMNFIVEFPRWFLADDSLNAETFTKVFCCLHFDFLLFHVSYAIVILFLKQRKKIWKNVALFQ